MLLLPIRGTVIVALIVAHSTTGKGVGGGAHLQNVLQVIIIIIITMLSSS